MYTFTYPCLLLACALTIARAAHAQSVDNPDFDDGIAGWKVSGSSVVWAPSFGFDSGSIHLATDSTASFATQCVWAEGGETFVATARVYAQCSGARLYAFWASASDCSDTGAFPNYFTRSTLANVWEPLAVTVPAQDGAWAIQLMLFNGGGCPDGVYFDDVSLQFDTIYGDGFELDGIE